jgi:hypothetical protein
MRAAGERDGKAWEKWLRMSFPENRQPSTKIDVSATGQQGMNVVWDARTRAELIEQRDRILVGARRKLKTALEVAESSY